MNSSQDQNVAPMLEEGDGNAVWGMPTYKDNKLANLTDDEYLAMVRYNRPGLIGVPVQ